MRRHIRPDLHYGKRENSNVRPAPVIQSSNDKRRNIFSRTESEIQEQQERMEYEMMMEQNSMLQLYVLSVMEQVGMF